ncbi:hypothetical protein [Rothia santali]|uniref:hypothetical protein n=1 Tax=Rothia santali TaxID=2949643 RepID=UPI0035A10E98
MSALLASFDAILSDLDGVVYAGPDPIDGAVESLNRAQEGGTAVAYVTNNASRSVDDVAEHLNELGLSTDGEHVVSSAQSAARLAVERLGAGAAVHACARPRSPAAPSRRACAWCARASGPGPCCRASARSSAGATSPRPRTSWPTPTSRGSPPTPT